MAPVIFSHALVREFGNHQLGGVGVALALKAIAEPSAGDALQLAEEVQLRFAIGIPPVAIEQALCQLVQQRGLDAHLPAGRP